MAYLAILAPFLLAALAGFAAARVTHSWRHGSWLRALAAWGAVGAATAAALLGAFAFSVRRGYLPPDDAAIVTGRSTWILAGFAIATFAFAMADVTGRRREPALLGTSRRPRVRVRRLVAYLVVPTIGLLTAMEPAGEVSDAAEARRAYGGLRATARRHPTDAEAAYHLAMAASLLDSHHVAVAEASRAIRLGTTQSNALNLLGWSYMRVGQHDSAVAVLRRAVGEDHGSYWTRWNYAAALWDAGRLPAADSQFVIAVRLAPDDAELLEAHGRLLLVLGQHDRALVRFRRAVTLSPGLVGYRVRLGQALLAAQRGDEALDHLRWAAARDSSRADVWAAIALASLGRAPDDSTAIAARRAGCEFAPATGGGVPRLSCADSLLWFMR